MSRRALVLAAHGSHADPTVNESILTLADQVRLWNEFDEVGAAFQQGKPNFSRVLDRFKVPLFVVVPVMASDGYYTREVIPTELRKNACYHSVECHVTPPVGTHTRIADLVADRVTAIMGRHTLTPRETTLLVVGHGTPRNPNSRSSTFALARNLVSREMCLEVVAAFLDDEPTVDSVLSMARGSCIVVEPFMIAAGPHATQDLPRQLGITLAPHSVPPYVQSVYGRLLVLDAALGTDSGILSIIRDLALGEVPTRNRPQVVDLQGTTSFRTIPRTPTYATQRPGPLKLGTRKSSLALWQANHVANALRSFDVDVELVALSTSGDRQQELAINELQSDSPFTDDIDAALLSGEIDLAVHSLKDLPLDLSPGLELAAVLPRGDPTESLVSRARESLSNLPAGSLIGTSSPRRRAQILSLRPDLRPVTIRGPVDDRLGQVQRGKFAAAVLATAGLQRLSQWDAAAETFPLSQFLPAPGQGALAVTVREDDEEIRRCVTLLDDPLSRATTQAELDLLRPYEGSTEWALAAYACWVHQAIHLRGRLISLDGHIVINTEVNGDARTVSKEALESLQAQLACPVVSR